jgi:hypothetical protein
MTFGAPKASICGSRHSSTVPNVGSQGHLSILRVDFVGPKFDFAGVGAALSDLRGDSADLKADFGPRSLDFVDL